MTRYLYFTVPLDKSTNETRRLQSADSGAVQPARRLAEAAGSTSGAQNKGSQGDLDQRPRMLTDDNQVCLTVSVPETLSPNFIASIMHKLILLSHIWHCKSSAVISELLNSHLLHPCRSLAALYSTCSGSRRSCPAHKPSASSRCSAPATRPPRPPSRALPVIKALPMALTQSSTPAAHCLTLMRPATLATFTTLAQALTS